MDRKAQVKYIGNRLDPVAVEHFQSVGDVDWYAEEAKADRLGVFGVFDNDTGERVASFAIKTETDLVTSDREGVIVAAFGRASFDLVKHVLPMIEHGLKDLGCITARVHTDRPGLVAKIARTREVMVVWGLDHG